MSAADPTVSRTQAGAGTGQRGHIAPKRVWVDGDLLASDRVPGSLLDWRVVDGGKWECYCDGENITGSCAFRPGWPVTSAKK